MKKRDNIIYLTVASICLFIFIVCIACANQWSYDYDPGYTPSYIGGVYGTAWSFLSFTLMTVIAWVYHAVHVSSKKIERNDISR